MGTHPTLRRDIILPSAFRVRGCVREYFIRSADVGGLLSLRMWCTDAGWKEELLVCRQLHKSTGLVKTSSVYLLLVRECYYILAIRDTYVRTHK